MFVQSTLLFLLQYLCSVVLFVFASSHARGKPCNRFAGSQQACSSAAGRGYVSAPCSAEAKLAGFTEGDLA